MTKKSLVLLLPILLSGCAQMMVRSQSERYANAYQYKPTHPSQVSVLRTFPAEPHEVIGEVTGSTESQYVQWDQIADEMRKKAAAIGGDAVIIQTENVAYAGAHTTPGSLNANYQNPSQSTTFSGSNIQSEDPKFNLSYVPPRTEHIWNKTSRGVVIRYKTDQIPRGVPGK